MQTQSYQELRAHQALWRLVPEEARLVAQRRQMAALAMRLCTRNDMTEYRAIEWVIGLKNLSQREFKNTAAGVFNNGDELQLWEFKEIVALNLPDDFITKRRLQQWQAAEEPWVLDKRWSYPLHLLDADVMAGFGGNYA